MSTTTTTETVAYSYSVIDRGWDTLDGHMDTWHDGTALPGETLQQAHDRLHRENGENGNGLITTADGDWHTHE